MFRRLWGLVSSPRMRKLWLHLLFMGIGVGMWLLVRFMLADITMGAIPYETKRSLYFGSTQYWPEFIKNGFWPLDALVAAGSGWLIFVGCSPMAQREDKQSLPKIALGGCSLLAGFGGLYGAISFGWYTGIEAVPAFAVGTLLLLGAFMAVMWPPIWLMERFMTRAEAKRSEVEETSDKDEEVTVD